MKRTWFGLVMMAALVACGPKGGPGGPGGAMPAAVASYAGLRWVPPDATYAVATRHTRDAALVLRDVVEAAGIVLEYDVGDVRRESTAELGVDLLSSEALAELGIDVERGVAVWSRGLGPSLALPLADPVRFAAWLEAKRGNGLVVQVARAHDTDVYTFRPDRDAAVHWAIVGDWFLAHLEVIAEREVEGAWFEAAWAAHGGLAAQPDFGAALDDATRRIGPEPALVGLVRAAALVQHPLLAPLVAAQPACAAPLAMLGRVFVGAGRDDTDARGAVVVELGLGVAGVRALALPVPAGWTAARQGAPLQVDVGLDLLAASAALAPCLGGNLARELDLEDARGGRVFVHAVDVRRLEGKGAAVVELVEPGFLDRTVDDLVGDIPGIGFLTKRRTVAGLAVTEIAVPSFPAFTYGTSGHTGFGGVGGALDAALAGGIVAGGDELFHAAVLPRVWSEATWDALLGNVIRRDGARAALIRRLRAWSLGEVAIHAEGRALVLTAHGRR